MGGRAGGRLAGVVRDGARSRLLGLLGVLAIVVTAVLCTAATVAAVSEAVAVTVRPATETTTRAVFVRVALIPAEGSGDALEARERGREVLGRDGVRDGLSDRLDLGPERGMRFAAGLGEGDAVSVDRDPAASGEVHHDLLGGAAVTTRTVVTVLIGRERSAAEAGTEAGSDVGTEAAATAEALRAPRTASALGECCVDLLDARGAGLDHAEGVPGASAEVALGEGVVHRSLDRVVDGAEPVAELTLGGRAGGLFWGSQWGVHGVPIICMSCYM